MSIFGLKISNGTLLNEAAVLTKDYNNDMIIEDFNYEYESLLSEVLSYSEDNQDVIINDLLKFNKKLFMLNNNFIKRSYLLSKLEKNIDIGKFYKAIHTDIPEFRRKVNEKPLILKGQSKWFNIYESTELAGKLIRIIKDSDNDHEIFNINDIVNTGVYLGDYLKMISEYPTLVDYMKDYLNMPAYTADEIPDAEEIKSRVSNAVRLDFPVNNEKCICSEMGERFEGLPEIIFITLNDFNRKMIDTYINIPDESSNTEAIRSSINALVNCIFISIICLKSRLIGDNKSYLTTTTLFNYLSEMFNK